MKKALMACCATLMVLQVDAVAETNRLTGADVVVFLGDSVARKADDPTGYLTLIRRDFIKRRLNTTLINAGRGWDRIASARERLDQDVLRHNPTIVIIDVGTNDVDEEGAGGKLRMGIFEMGLNDLVWRIQRAGARPILCTMGLLDERAPGTNPYDADLESYSEIVRSVAAKKGCRVIDVRRHFTTYLADHNPENKASGILTVDGAHLNARGNWLMANLVLEALGMPALDEDVIESTP